MHIEPIEKGWNLYIIEYGEQSPLANHGFMELGTDDKSKSIFGTAAMIRIYGLDSIVAACRGYVNRTITARENYHETVN